MNSLRAILRNPFFRLAVLLTAGAAAWVGYFLATFDLNLYREDLAGELSRRLRMPVQLGAARLELRKAGICFRFDKLHIGSEQTAAELQADGLWLQLAWHGLLLKKPVLSQIALQAPRLRLDVPAAPATAGETVLDLDIMHGLRIRQLEIQEGAFAVTWHDADGGARSLNISGIAAEIGNLGLGRTAALEVRADLAQRPQGPARLALLGKTGLPDSGNWRDIDWDLTLDGKGLAADQLAGLFPQAAGVRATGTFDLALHLRCASAGELAVQAKLTGSKLHVKPGQAAREPIPVRQLELRGIWQSRERHQLFRQVALQLDSLRLTGEGSLLASDSGYELTGRLRDSSLPLDILGNWVPADRLADNPLLSRRLPGGLLTVGLADFRATLPTDPRQTGSFAVEALQGELKGLSWDLGRERTAALTSLRLNGENNRWRFDQGQGSIAGLQAGFAASVTPQDDSPPQITLDFELGGPTGEFAALQPKPLPEGLTLAGTLALKGHLNGTLEQYRLGLEIDLSQLEVAYGEHFHLPPTPGSLLTANGSGSRSTLAVEQADLKLAALSGSLAGSLDWSGATALDLSAHFSLPELADAASFAAVIDRLKLRGGVDCDVRLAGPLAELQPQVGVDLSEISIAGHGIVADISRLSGHLLFERQGLRSEQLTAMIGKSPVTLKARVADLNAPRLALSVQAPSILASELIFRSDRRLLRDVDGHLLLDRAGLWFAPVHVRLDGGTRATVTGSVRNFASPQVDLDITGEYANVEEIIALWTDETPAAAAARLAHTATAEHARPVTRIRAAARDGDLYGMKFANASALIVPTHEMLLIHPLAFSIGEGSCAAQVLVDFTGPHSLLRVSGHADNVDAYEVYNELLDRKAIMRGRLSGDFYLQGELGEGRFLKSSYGSFDMTVRDGVMRHSPVLSTIFSLLNVSQLFKFQLPDVDREGVPFTLLTAELAIDKGLLSSERVRVDSEAMDMSYLGQYDMIKDSLDLLVIVKPLGTIDTVVTSLPIAGWILGGEERAVITAQFRVTGSADAPKIEAIPISAMSKGVLGIVQRTLGLPLKLIEDPAILWGGGGKKP